MCFGVRQSRIQVHVEAEGRLVIGFPDKRQPKPEGGGVSSCGRREGWRKKVQDQGLSALFPGS